MSGASRNAAISVAARGVAVTSRPASMNARAAFEDLNASKSESPEGADDADDGVGGAVQTPSRVAERRSDRR